MSKIKTSIYAGMRDFSADQTNEFDRARTNLATPFLYRVLDLSVARTNEIHNISGDFLFCDLATNGTAIIELNNQMDAPDAPITFSAGMGLSAPFKQLKISNSAQAGAKMILLYSTGNTIIPSSAMGNVNSIIQPVNVNDVISSICQHVSVSANPNGAVSIIAQLVAPATNANGLMLRRAYVEATCGTSGSMSAGLIATPNTPADLNSGANRYVLLYATSTQQGTQARAADVMNRKLPAGWGIWLYGVNNTATQAYSNGSVDFEVL